jgi:hypothetical protein
MSRIHIRPSAFSLANQYLLTSKYLSPHVVSNSLIHIHSPENIIQVVLSTAHPAKFSEAVTTGLEEVEDFHFTRDVLPKEFVGLLEKEKRVILVDEPTPEAVKAVIDSITGKEGAHGDSASI